MRVLLLAFLSLLGTAGAQLNCSDVTISTSAEADAVRRACPIVGLLNLSANLTESISLDGVEEVNAIRLYGCEWFYNDHDCAFEPPFTVSSSTLHEIGMGGIYTWYAPRLQRLLFPNLHTARGGISLNRADNLTTLDITSLSRSGSIYIEAERLTEIKHNALEGYVNGTQAGVRFGQTATPSVDSFYSRPLNLSGVPTPWGNHITINAYSMPNVRRVTLGWAEVDSAEIRGHYYPEQGGEPPEPLDVVLGGADTTRIRYRKLSVEGNTITALTALPNLQSLNVESVSITRTNITSLDSILPILTNVSSLELYYNANLSAQGLLPPQAAGWKNLDFTVSDYRLVVGPDVDWTWPTGDIDSVRINAQLTSNDAFRSFLEARNPLDVNSTARPRVLNKFQIRGHEGSTGFNCTPFHELSRQGVLPQGEDYSCSVSKYGSDGTRAAAPLSFISWVAAAALAALLF